MPEKQNKRFTANVFLLSTVKIILFLKRPWELFLKFVRFARPTQWLPARFCAGFPLYDRPEETTTVVICLWLHLCRRLCTVPVSNGKRAKPSRPGYVRFGPLMEGGGERGVLGEKIPINMPLTSDCALCVTAVLAVCSWSAADEPQVVTVNYDLLVGDISFYNRTMVFALREDAAHGEDILQLIENLMAPWIAEPASDIDSRVVSIDVRAVASDWMVTAVIAIGTFGFFLFFITAVLVVYSLPLTVYLTTKAFFDIKETDAEVIWWTRTSFDRRPPHFAPTRRRRFRPHTWAFTGNT